MAGTQPPQHPFYALPAELILTITSHLPPESFINFAFAHYPLLSHHGLAPALSPPRVHYITHSTTLPRLFPLLKIPAEITLAIMRYLSPIDTMRFVVANYAVLVCQGIAPEMEVRGEVVRGLMREAGVEGEGEEG